MTVFSSFSIFFGGPENAPPIFFLYKLNRHELVQPHQMLRDRGSNVFAQLDLQYVLNRESIEIVVKAIQTLCVCMANLTNFKGPLPPAKQTP